MEYQGTHLAHNILIRLISEDCTWLMKIYQADHRPL